MTKFRVGVGGATVFDEDGNAIGELQPGAVIVPGSLKVPGSLADQHLKRLADYSDKMLRPYEDKATPPRQPDPRLRNPLAGTS